MQGKFRDGDPQIELVAGGATAKALKRAAAQVRRKRATARRTRPVDRAGTAHLIAHPADGHKTHELQDLGHANPRANFGKINARHRSHAEKRNPYRKSLRPPPSHTIFSGARLRRKNLKNVSIFGICFVLVSDFVLRV